MRKEKITKVEKENLFHLTSRPLLYFPLLYITILYFTLHHSDLLYITLLFFALLYFTLHHSNLLHITLLHFIGFSGPAALRLSAFGAKVMAAMTYKYVYLPIVYFFSACFNSFCFRLI